jgi:hypothetical protein
LINTDWEVVCPVTFRHKGLPDRIINSVKGLDDSFVRTKIIRCDLVYPISKITGNVTYIFGDVSNIEGNVSNIFGDVSNIEGNVSKITGNTTEIIIPTSGFKW